MAHLSKKKSNNEDEKVSEDAEKAERGPSARSGELLIGVQSFVERKPTETAVLEPTSAGQATCDNVVDRNNREIKGAKFFFSEIQKLDSSVQNRKLPAVFPPSQCTQSGTKRVTQLSSLMALPPLKKGNYDSTDIINYIKFLPKRSAERAFALKLLKVVAQILAGQIFMQI